MPRSPAADGQGKQRSDGSIAGFLKCKYHLEDCQCCSRVHVVRGDVKPVSAIGNSDLCLAGPVFLCVYHKIPRCHSRPVVRLAVLVERHRRNSGSDVLFRDTHPPREKRHDLQHGSQVQINRIVLEGLRELLVDLLVQLRLDAVLAEPRGQVEDLRDFLHLG